MKILRLLGFAVLIASFVSCQKEISLDLPPTSGGGGNGGGGGGNTGNLLSKIVSKQGTDSTVFTFGYNSANKLTTYNILGKTGGVEINQKNTYTRDAQNRITQIREIQVIPSVPGFPMGGTIDTSYTNFFYSGTDTKIVYSKRQSEQLGIVFEDSTVYTYSGTRITKSKSYIKVPFVGWQESDETVYTYDANGNIMTAKDYDLQNGPAELVTERQYSHDSKVSPLQLGQEAIITFLEERAGSNNTTTFQLIDYVTGTGNMTSSATITYRSNNTPASATGTVLQGGVSVAATSTYYYQ